MPVKFNPIARTQSGSAGRIGSISNTVSRGGGMAGGLSMASSALRSFAGIYAQNQQEKKIEEIDQAKAYVGQAEPNFLLDFEKTRQESLKTSGDKHMDQTLHNFKVGYDGLIGSAPSKTAERMLVDRRNALMLEVGKKALGDQNKIIFQAQIRQDQQADESAMKLVYGDSNFLEEQVGLRQTGILSNMAYDDETKAELRQSSANKLSQSAAMGMIERDPVGTLSLMQDHLSGKKSYEPFKFLELQDKIKLKNGAESATNQLIVMQEKQLRASRQKARQQISGITANLSAMIENGQAPPQARLDKADFMGAYEDEDEAIRAFSEYNIIRDTAEISPRLNGLSGNELASFEGQKINPQSKNYAEQSKGLNQIKSLAAKIIEARNEDPVTQAIKTGEFGLQSLSADGEGYAEELQNRLAARDDIEKLYGKEAMINFSLITKNEAGAVVERLNKSLMESPTEAINILAPFLDAPKSMRSEVGRVLASQGGSKHLPIFMESALGLSPAKQSQLLRGLTTPISALNLPKTEKEFGEFFADESSDFGEAMNDLAARTGNTQFNEYYNDFVKAGTQLSGHNYTRLGDIDDSAQEAYKDLIQDRLLYKEDLATIITPTGTNKPDNAKLRSIRENMAMEYQAILSAGGGNTNSIKRMVDDFKQEAIWANVGDGMVGLIEPFTGKVFEPSLMTFEKVNQYELVRKRASEYMRGIK